MNNPARATRRGRPIRAEAAGPQPWRSLDAWIRREGLTVPDVSRRMGMARQTVYRWLRTSQSPDIEQLLRLCRSVCPDDPARAALMLCDVWGDAILPPGAAAARDVTLISARESGESPARLAQRAFFTRHK